jgi:hypothetical protein
MKFMKAVISLIAMGTMSVGTASLALADNASVAKIKKDVTSSVSSKPSFCIISLNYGSTSTQPNFYIACDGNANSSIDLPNSDPAIADLTFAISVAIGLGMKLNSCSFGNYFHSDTNSFQEEHCYLTR